MHPSRRPGRHHGEVTHSRRVAGAPANTTAAPELKSILKKGIVEQGGPPDALAGSADAAPKRALVSPYWLKPTTGLPAGPVGASSAGENADPYGDFSAGGLAHGSDVSSRFGTWGSAAEPPPSALIVEVTNDEKEVAGVPACRRQYGGALLAMAAAASTPPLTVAASATPRWPGASAMPVPVRPALDSVTPVPVASAMPGNADAARGAVPASGRVVVSPEPPPRGRGEGEVVAQAGAVLPNRPRAARAKAFSPPPPAPSVVAPAVEVFSYAHSRRRARVQLRLRAVASAVIAARRLSQGARHDGLPLEPTLELAQATSQAPTRGVNKLFQVAAATTRRLSPPPVLESTCAGGSAYDDDSGMYDDFTSVAAGTPPQRQLVVNGETVAVESPPPLQYTPANASCGRPVTTRSEAQQIAGWFDRAPATPAASSQLTSYQAVAVDLDAPEPVDVILGRARQVSMAGTQPNRHVPAVHDSMSMALQSTMPLTASGLRQRHATAVSPSPARDAGTVPIASSLVSPPVARDQTPPRSSSVFRQEPRGGPPQMQSLPQLGGGRTVTAPESSRKARTSPPTLLNDEQTWQVSRLRLHSDASPHDTDSPHDTTEHEGPLEGQRRIDDAAAPHLDRRSLDTASNTIDDEMNRDDDDDELGDGGSFTDSVELEAENSYCVVPMPPPPPPPPPLAALPQIPAIAPSACDVCTVAPLPRVPPHPASCAVSSLAAQPSNSEANACPPPLAAPARSVEPLVRPYRLSIASNEDTHYDFAIVVRADRLLKVPAPVATLQRLQLPSTPTAARQVAVPAAGTTRLARYGTSDSAPEEDGLSPEARGHDSRLPAFANPLSDSDSASESDSDAPSDSSDDGVSESRPPRRVKNHNGREMRAHGVERGSSHDAAIGLSALSDSSDSDESEDSVSGEGAASPGRSRGRLSVGARILQAAERGLSLVRSRLSAVNAAPVTAPAKGAPAALSAAVGSAPLPPALREPALPATAQSRRVTWSSPSPAPQSDSTSRVAGSSSTPGRADAAPAPPPASDGGGPLVGAQPLVSAGAKHKCSEILAALRAAGLYAKRVRSLSRRTWLLKIAAPEWRLELEAERIRLRLRRVDGGWSRFKRSMRHAFIPVTADSDAAAAGAQRQGEDEADAGLLPDPHALDATSSGRHLGRASFFHSSDRQILIDHILRSSVQEGGAGLGVGTELGAYVTHMFPLHMQARLAELRSDWLAIWRPVRSHGARDRVGVVEASWYAERRLVSIGQEDLEAAAAAPAAGPPGAEFARGQRSHGGGPGSTPSKQLLAAGAGGGSGGDGGGGGGDGQGGGGGPLACVCGWPLRVLRGAAALVGACCAGAGRCARSAGRCCCRPLSQPLDRIAAYFGETTAFYFAWLEFYTQWLLLPAAGGVLVFLTQVSAGTLDVTWVPLYSLLVALWSIVMLELWKRRNAVLAQRWGVLNYEDEEAVRPQFAGALKLDAATGAVLRVYPAWRRAATYAITAPIILAFVAGTVLFLIFLFSTRDHMLAQLAAFDADTQSRAAALAALAAAMAAGNATAAQLTALQAAVPAAPSLDWAVGASLVAAWNGGVQGFLSGVDGTADPAAAAAAPVGGGAAAVAPPPPSSLSAAILGKLDAWGAVLSAQHDWRWWVSMTLPPLIFGLVMPAANAAFGRVALVFNGWENHATQSAYSNHRIAKVFFYRFSSSFVSLFYYAFSPQHNSLATLFVQLATFLLVGQLLKSNVLGLAVACARKGHAECRARRRVRHAEDSGLTEGKRGRRLLRHATSVVWEEARMAEHDAFNDYAELLIQFGYVTFFAWAFPLGPAVALLNNVLDMRTGAYRLCYLTQRPVAHKAGGIGVWYSVLQAMALLAVLTNCAHLATSSAQFAAYFPALSDVQRLLLVVAFEHAILAVRVALHFAIPAAPAGVARRAARDALALANLQGRKSVGDAAAARVSLVGEAQHYAPAAPPPPLLLLVPGPRKL